MRCARCPVEVEPPWFNMTPDQLEQMAADMMRHGQAPGTVANGSYALDEIARFRRGLCWGCGYNERQDKRDRVIEDTFALESAQDAMANEGGRGSA